MRHSIPSEAQLLDLVRGLSRELRPGVNGIDRLGLDHELERDFGLDSLGRVELLARIERELGVRLAEAAFAEAETPRDLLRQMAEAGPAEAHAPAPAAMEEAAPEQLPDTLLTLVELLDWHVAQHGERVHITLEDGAAHSDDISYRTLQAEARVLAVGLREHGLGNGDRVAPDSIAGDRIASDSITGDRVAIMLPTGREFFAAFYGTLYAGCVPVPLYPPARPSQIEEHMRRIAGIVANAGAALLVTDARAKPLGHLLRAQCPSLRAVATVADLSRAAAVPLPPPPRPEDAAFLQYTSGSTGNPKGVVLSHASLLANLDAMARASGISAKDTFVSWLPLYHDMGLIGACMGSLYVGFRLVLMSPLTFLVRPGRAADAVWAAWAWAVYLSIVPLAWLLIAAAPGLGLRRCIARTCARLALALTGLRPRLTGAQHLAGLDAPLIVVANHASFLDALILTAVLPPRFAYVAKQELLHKPLAAIPLRRLGSAFVERFDSARGVEDTRALEKQLRAGESMVFFPEGTFRCEPGLLSFRMGAFILAARTGVPVLPVSLTGTRTLLQGEAWRPHYSVLKVYIGKPISSVGEDWQAAVQLRDSARRQILAQLAEPDAAG